MQVKHRIRFSLFVLLALSIVALSLMYCTAAAQDDNSTAAALQAAITGPQRSEGNKARDQYRHPLQTLTFFGIKPDTISISE
jgi:predicted methyltransferase